MWIPYLTIHILYFVMIINFQVSHKLVLPLNKVMVLRPLSSKDMALFKLLLRVKTSSFKCFLTRPLCYVIVSGTIRSKLKYKLQGLGLFWSTNVGEIGGGLGVGGCYQVLCG